MKALGIDLGSTSIKSAILDLDKGELLSTHSLPFPQPSSNLPERYFEVELTSVLASVQSLIARAKRVEPSVEDLFLSSQMGGVVLSQDTAQANATYISWRDLRTTQPHSHGATFLDHVRTRIGSSCLQSLGNELRAGSTLAILFWLNELRLLNAATRFSTLGSYVASQLASEPVSIGRTDAIGVWDFVSGDWNRDAFHRLGLDQLVLPNISPDDALPMGRSTQSFGALNIYPALGDHPCSLAGVGLGLGELSINVSTGSQTSLLTERLQLGSWQTRYGLHGQYINTMTHLPAGRSLEAIVDMFATLPSMDREKVWRVVHDELKNEVDGGLEVDLAFYDGPLGCRGSIQNISLENLSLGNLFRGAFRSMASNYRKCARQLDPTESWNRLVLSGGLTQRFTYLKKQIENRFPCPIRETSEGEDALLGLMSWAKHVLELHRISSKPVANPR